MKPPFTAVMAALAIGLMATGAQAFELPAILKSHPDKASFTRLNDDSNQPIRLFNGTDYTNFHTFESKVGRDQKNGSFRITDGAMHFGGDHFGYVATSGSFKNYYLRVQVRWGKEKYGERKNAVRDSGVLYHVAPDLPDKVWPTCAELQIQENDFGDLWLVEGATGRSPQQMERINDRFCRYIRTENFEKPLGEWNIVELICLGDRSEHYVNGHKVNEATGLSVTEGRILLQLEGAEVFFKDIVILPLK